MKLNRRNALIGLGAIATGGGALFGSGAFSSVEANREVTIGVTGDSSANLALSANNTNIANDSGGSANNQVGIDGSSFNPDATTEYDDAIDIVNNASGERYVAIQNPTIGNGTATFYVDSGVNDTISNVSDLSTSYVAIAAGADLTVGISFNADDTAASTATDTVTIEAVDEDATSDFSTLSPTGKGGTESS